MPVVVLYEPEIPPNTGNIARLCAATFTELHIVGQTGFRMDNKALKRAGLDYWPQVRLFRHTSLEEFFAANNWRKHFYFSTHAKRNIYETEFDPDCSLIFGPETRGLPRSLIQDNPSSSIKIPMPNSNVRSLNLATSVGIALFEVYRQCGFNSAYHAIKLKT